MMIQHMTFKMFAAVLNAFPRVGREVHVDWVSRGGSTHKGYFPVAWLKENDYSLRESFLRKQREAEPPVAVS